MSDPRAREHHRKAEVNEQRRADCNDTGPDRAGGLCPDGGVQARIAEVVRRHTCPGPRKRLSKWDRLCDGCDWTGDDHAAHVAEVVAAAVCSWDGLLSILDTLYPESVFPTLEDHQARDTGPRIVSLLRQINRLRSAPASEGVSGA